MNFYFNVYIFLVLSVLIWLLKVINNTFVFLYLEFEHLCEGFPSASRWWEFSFAHVLFFRKLFVSCRHSALEILYPAFILLTLH